MPTMRPRPRHRADRGARLADLLIPDSGFAFSVARFSGVVLPRNNLGHTRRTSRRPPDEMLRDECLVHERHTHHDALPIRFDRGDADEIVRGPGVLRSLKSKDALR